MNILHEKDSTYKHLADEAYNITPNQKKVTIETSNHSEIDFKVIGFRQNKFNGLKMAGLSPMDKNKNVNTDELYIVYAGTDPDLLADFGSDVVEDLRIGMAKFGGGLRIPPTKKESAIYGDLNKKMIDYNDGISGISQNIMTNPISQSKESYIFTGALINKQKPKHVYSAAHSLGGGLALLNGVMYNFDGVRAFSAPNTYDLLPDNVKANYRSEKYDGKFINYVHRSDIIGNSDLFSQRIGTQIYGKDVGSFSLLNPILGHGTDTFEFKGDNVRIKMDTDEMSKIASDLKASCEFVDDAIKAYQKYMDDTKAAAKRIERKYTEKIRTGNYKHIKPSDIEDYMEELSVSGKYEFYNDTAFETVMSELNRIRKNVESFADKLKHAGEKMESRDKEIGELYKIFER
ncbi:hypothetical protein JGT88_10875 [Staphylococcus aureus]|uniref:hypothetical protein n=5 Tax=Staphylococcus aureus TaxID=1280 RepID=UPI0005C12953|nr:hypothetical protein [Staphylococcus aureus]EJX2089211.1 hypothetical protein [Staphylococcus aureus]KIT84103.1 hypothetical protein QT22_10250 [Staphylococcus aureus]MBJ6148003.1 hypothetical protein [Staphylococcus aureus]MBJ6151163.1 hypothetical protein [Staphylococcus aureus]MCB8226114.1 hypothetical protein [Staphylococcus aureus]